MTDIPKKRIEWIDEFKGFVLLLVCLYHVDQRFNNIQMGMVHLAAFRMSAFFFISGMLFSTRRFSTFKSYALHKTKSLLFPYIWLSLLFLALDPVVWNFEWFSRAPKMTIMNIHPEITNLWDYLYWNLIKIFIAGKSSIGSGPLWFVFTLYSISLIFYGVQSLANKFSQPIAQKIFIGLFALASLALGWFFSRNQLRFPLGLERDFTTIFFFALGYLSKNALSLLDRCKLPTLAAIAITTFILYGIIEDGNPWFSIMNNQLGKNILIFLGSSFFGILGLITAFQLIARISSAKTNCRKPIVASCCKAVATPRGVLRNISRNALIILAVHWWFLLVLRIIFKAQLDKPGIAYLSIPLTAIAVIISIPLFRSILYPLLGKKKISVRESLSIK